MEAKINIAEILKDKPLLLKFYSTTFGRITFNGVHKGKVYFFSEDTNVHSVKQNGKMYDGGECIIFPSKEMRDWEKFSWKKGDVLVSNDSDSHIIFKGFSKNDYTTFEGKHWISESKKRHVSCLQMHDVQDYHIEDNKDSGQTYINAIEERLGGKLNRETLEVEKPQPEFKDGDIVTAVFTDGDEMICVFKEKIEQDYMGYCGFFSKGKHEANVYMDLGDYCICNDSPICKEIRLATEEEKQQLFEALAKEGKTWDAEKKQIVDLQKYEFNVFDWCLIQVSRNDVWHLAQYASKYEDRYYFVGGMNFRMNKEIIILPYNEDTKHLLGTTDGWKGGEQ